MRKSLRTATLSGLLIGAALGIGVGRAFISSSVPFVNEALLFILAGLIFEAAGRVLSRTFFTESQMERRSK